MEGNKEKKDRDTETHTDSQEVVSHRNGCLERQPMGVSLGHRVSLGLRIGADPHHAQGPRVGLGQFR